MGEEIEVKLGAWPGFEMPPLDGAAAGLRAEQGGQRTLEAVYYDADDLRLIRAGITVRHRSGEGGEHGAWTLKLPVTAEGPAGALVRDELVVPGDAASVPSEVAVRLRPWLRTAPLVAVAHLQTVRRSAILWLDPVADEPQASDDGSQDGGELVFGPPEPGAEPELEAELESDPDPVPVETAPALEPAVANSSEPAEPAEPRIVGSVDDDEVSVLAGNRVAARFREVEVEVAADLPEGPGRLLGAVVDRLRAAGAGAPDPTPKLVRALGPRALAPPDLVVDGVGRDSTAAEVLRAGIAAAVGRIVEHDQVIRADVDPEGIHQARVGTRRLRSDMRTFAPLLDASWSEPLRVELQWLAGELGEVRDRDVLAARLRGRQAGLGDGERVAVDVLVARLDRERNRALRRAVAALDSHRYLVLLERLAEAADCPRTVPEADQPARDLLPGMAGIAFHKLRKGVRKLEKHPPDEALHALRIKAKRARYAADIAVPVIGERAVTYVKAVGKLQDVLGDHHDCAVAVQWLLGNLRSATRAQAFALGLLVAGQHQEEAELRSRWRSVWGDLDRRKITSWLS